MVKGFSGGGEMGIITYPAVVAPSSYQCPSVWQAYMMFSKRKGNLLIHSSNVLQKWKNPIQTNERNVQIKLEMERPSVYFGILQKVD